MTEKPEASSSLQPADKGSTGLVRVMDIRVAIANRVLSDVASRKTPETSISESSRRITLEVAERFLSNERSFKLDNYTYIDCEAAEVLSEHKGAALILSGLRSIDVTTAQCLARFKGSFVDLKGIRYRDDLVVDAISEYRGSALTLDGLIDLSEASAVSLAARQRNLWLSLTGLLNLRGTTAAALANFKGGKLLLDGLTHLSDDAAEALARCNSAWISLLGLTDISHSARLLLKNGPMIILPSKLR